MRKQFLQLVRLLIVMLILGLGTLGVFQVQEVAAQGTDLDATLARATVKGYLISLKRGSSGSPVLTSFYLTDEASESQVARSLRDLQIESYEITAAKKLGEGVYEITASVSPEDWVVVANVSKVTTRWQITNLAWLTGPREGQSPATSAETETEVETPAEAETSSESETEATPSEEAATEPDEGEAAEAPSTEAAPAEETTSAEAEASMAAGEAEEVEAEPATEPAMEAVPTGLTAEVIPAFLNIRSGPGIDFEAVGVLKGGDVVDVVNRHVSGNWYQISQNGEVVGWISAKPKYVISSGTTAETEADESADAESTSTQAAETETAPAESPAETEVDERADESAESATSTESAPSGSGATATIEVLAYALNLRGGPGLDYPIQGRIARGDVVEVVGRDSIAYWVQVALNGETIGWISSRSEHVTTSGDVSAAPVVDAPPVSPVTSNGKTTNAPIVTVQPAASTGSRLILQEKSGGPIYLVSPDRTSLTYLTSGIDPALSPDGTQLALTRWENGDIGKLWVYDLNTGVERLVPTEGEMVKLKSPTWSSDGHFVVANYLFGGRRGVEENCKKPGQPIPPEAYDFNFGSESGRICYKLPADTFWTIVKINAADGSRQNMSSDQYSYAPTWDPVNDWRVVYRNELGLQQLDLNRNEYFPFTDDTRDKGPVFSPDGQYVAVSYRQHDHWEVYTISTADGSRNRLTPVSILDERNFNSAAPAWSPDGSQIIFITDRTGPWGFWIMNADGSNPRPLLAPQAAAQLNPEYRAVDERLVAWR